MFTLRCQLFSQCYLFIHQENNESFLWSTTSPSPTLGRITPPSRTTYSLSTLARSKISSVWKEPISFVVTHLRPYTTYLFEVSAVTTEAGYIDSTIVRTPESGMISFFVYVEKKELNYLESNLSFFSYRCFLLKLPSLSVTFPTNNRKWAYQLQYSFIILT